MKRFLGVTIVLFGLTVVALPRPAVSQVPATTVPAYTYVDLGTLRGKGTTVTGINAAGQISGYGYYEPAGTGGTYTYNSRAFRITPVDYGSGPVWFTPDASGYNAQMAVFTLPSTYRYSEAQAINSAGAVAGQMLADGYTTPQDALYGAPDLTATPISDVSVWAWGINDRTTVLGELIPRKGGGTVPTIWRRVNGSWAATDLGIGSNTQGRGINNLDQVVGTDGNLGVAYLWLPSPAYSLSAGKTSLGTFGGSQSVGYAVNDYGQVVGYAVDGAGFGRAFLWTPPTDLSGFGTPGGLTDLTSADWLGGTARALTTPAAGQPLQIVGQGQSPSNQARAIIWDSTGREMRDLNVLVTNPPQEGMMEARGINADGLIVGNTYYTLPGGGQVTRPFVLVPNAALPAATAVPNSATDAAAQPSSSSQIVLTWTDAALDENGYRIDRSTDGARWAQVASLPANSTSYMDTGLIQGMQYQYRILPFNVKGYAAAAQASAVTFGAPVAPTNCRIPAVNVSTTSLRVAWTNNSNTQTAVYVQYAKNSTFTGAMEVSAAGTATQLDLTGLTNNTTYYVRVRGVNAAGSSGYSNTASATTPRK